MLNLRIVRGRELRRDLVHERLDKRYKRQDSYYSLLKLTATVVAEVYDTTADTLNNNRDQSLVPTPYTSLLIVMYCISKRH